MKKRVLFWLSLFLSWSSCHAQNLVPNPSFENYRKLPCSLNEFNIQELLYDWSQPIRTTSDYWNSLSDTSCFLNPRSIGRSARTGSGTAGIIAAIESGNFKLEYKEYLQVTLLDSLKKNKLYYGEFYAYNVNVEFTLTDILESNNLGLAFSDSAILDFSFTRPNHIFLKTQLKETELIHANNSWHKINGCFAVNKPYQNLLIGNFDKIDSTFINRVSNDFQTAAAYYLIDDVSIIELPYNISSLENKITQCYYQDSVILNAYIPGAKSYEWSTGSRNSSLTVKAKASYDYTVKIYFDECVYQHTFSLDYVPDINFGPDTVLCNEETLRLKAGESKDGYTWNDGTSDPIKHINTSGTYWAESPSACIVQDTITVSFIDCPGFIPNVFTPNETDSINPFFTIENIDNRRWSLRVLNRWGERVYETDHYRNNWDGKGVADGIYYYDLYSSELNKRKRGWVKIIR